MKRLIVVALAFATAACQSVPSDPYAAVRGSALPLHDTRSGITVGAAPLVSEKQVKTWFGSDLTDNDMVAIRVSIDVDPSTRGNVVVVADEITLGATSASTNASADLTARQLTAGEKATMRMKAAAAGLISGGLIGGVLLAALTDPDQVQKMHDMALQNRMVQVVLPSKTLSPGSSTYGFVFFPIRPEWAAQPDLTLAMSLKNTTSGELTSFSFRLPSDQRPYLGEK